MVRFRDSLTICIQAVLTSSCLVGHPITVSKARSHIKSSPYGSRIHFHALDPLEYLTQNPNACFSTVVFSHSLWYFVSQSTILATFQALYNVSPRLCVAEYSFSASLPQQIPHVLAARGHALYYSFMSDHQRQTSTPNIRCAAPPADIKRLAEEAGFIIEREGTIIPADTVEDGSWEVKLYLNPKFEEGVNQALKEVAKRKVLAFKPQVKKALEAVGGQGYRTMDVWWAIMRKS